MGVHNSYANPCRTPATVAPGCPSEDETFWTRFLRDRGLGAVRLVISDAHEGLKKSIRRCFAGASWRRCRVHYARNLLAKVPKSHTRSVSAEPGD